jgi:short-subunit dehydrogenase
LADRSTARGLNVDLLVDNTGFGMCGRFEEIFWGPATTTGWWSTSSSSSPPSSG